MGSIENAAKQNQIMVKNATLVVKHLKIFNAIKILFCSIY